MSVIKQQLTSSIFARIEETNSIFTSKKNTDIVEYQVSSHGNLMLDKTLIDDLPNQDYGSNIWWEKWNELISKFIENTSSLFKDSEEIKKSIRSFQYSHSDEIEDLYETFFNKCADYNSEKDYNSHYKNISIKSATCYLLIMPILLCKDVNLSINANNGNIVLSLHKKKNILNLELDSIDLIYYSLAGRNRKIFNITGKSKFKDKWDLIELHRILNISI
jgi:hypothetical protein